MPHDRLGCVLGHRHVHLQVAVAPAHVDVDDRLRGEELPKHLDVPGQRGIGDRLGRGDQVSLGVDHIATERRHRGIVDHDRDTAPQRTRDAGFERRRIEHTELTDDTRNRDVTSSERAARRRRDTHAGEGRIALVVATHDFVASRP